MGLKQKLNHLLMDESGQSTTEYILILSLVVMVAMKFREQFSSRLNKITGKMFDDMDRAITTNE